MRLHQTPLFPSDTSSTEEIERAKVLRSLYVRDKIFCTTRGAISWLPSHDCNIVPQLAAGIEKHVHYSSRLQLAVMQDEIYSMQRVHSGAFSYLTRLGLQTAFKSIEQQLQRFATTFSVFDPNASYPSPDSALIPMEFLNTRILALRHSFEPSHMEQIRSDARASCLLLLIAYGDRDQQMIDTFRSLTCHRTSGSTTGQKDPTNNETMTMVSASTLDAFPVLAFFSLLEKLSLPRKDAGEWKSPRSDADLDLLRRVSERYTQLTAWMQYNSYHFKVARVFSRLMDIAEILLNDGHQPNPSASQGERMGVDSPSPSRDDISYAMDIANSSVNITQRNPRISPHGIISPHNLPTTTLPWDSQQLPWSLGAPTPSDLIDMGEFTTNPSHDLLTHLFPDSPRIQEGTEVLTSYHSLPHPGVVPRKRTRLETPPLSVSTERNGYSSMSVSSSAHSEAVPFHLIS